MVFVHLVLLAAALDSPCGPAGAQALDAEANQLRREVKAAQSAVLKDELKSRRRVLRRLGYVTDEGVVTDKGAVRPPPCGIGVAWVPTRNIWAAATLGAF